MWVSPRRHVSLKVARDVVYSGDSHEVNWWSLINEGKETSASTEEFG